MAPSPSRPARGRRQFLKQSLGVAAVAATTPAAALAGAATPVADPAHPVAQRRLRKCARVSRIRASSPEPSSRKSPFRSVGLGQDASASAVADSFVTGRSSTVRTRGCRPAMCFPRFACSTDPRRPLSACWKPACGHRIREHSASARTARPACSVWSPRDSPASFPSRMSHSATGGCRSRCRSTRFRPSFLTMRTPRVYLPPCFAIA